MGSPSLLSSKVLVSSSLLNTLSASLDLGSLGSSDVGLSSSVRVCVCVCVCVCVVGLRVTKTCPCNCAVQTLSYDSLCLSLSEPKSQLCWYLSDDVCACV